MRGDFLEDVRVFLEQEFEGAYPLWQCLLRLVFVQGFIAVAVYRFGRWAYRLPKPIAVPFRILWFLLSKGVEIVAGIMLPASVEAGPGLYIGHFGPTIVNGGVKIGQYCQIAHGVTLGTKGAGRGNGIPVIGDHVYIGAGAKVLGPVRVGNHAVIGANAVVVKDVPDGAVVGGIPARIIGKNVVGHAGGSP
ncbi:MAG: serine acetyltransferase [Thermodesulfobacteriota bacterium]